MKLLWNKELKRLAIVLSAAGLLVLVFCNLIMYRYRTHQIREYTMAAAALIGSVTEAYPGISEESILQVLNQSNNMDYADNKNSTEKGIRILEQYGVFLDGKAGMFVGQERRMDVLQLELCLLAAASGIGTLVIVFHYMGKRQEGLRSICRYMEELARGNYGLDIQDNGDNELSGLKNEVYKLTVFFREQAQQAAANRRALADSVADISHQLKTPLTSVMVLADNLSESEGMPEATRRHFLSEISRQITGISWLVSTLLKLSRLDAGVVELKQEPLSVARLANEVCEKLELNAEWNQVEFSVNISDGIAILGDFQWLTEAVLNIVKNAIEHSTAGSVVELRAEDNDVYTLLTVHNWGPVIPDEEQRHLFERFYRGGSPRSDSTGIGLALSKEIVARLGGYITVESKEEKGTFFFIKFLKCH